MTKELTGFHVKEITFKLPEELREEFLKLYLRLFDAICDTENELVKLVEEEQEEQVREQIGLVLYTIMRFRGFNPADYTITEFYDDEEA